METKYAKPLPPEELFKNLPKIDNTKFNPNKVKELLKMLTTREEYNNRDPKLVEKLKKTAELKRLWREAKKNNASNTQELYEAYKKSKEVG